MKLCWIHCCTHYWTVIWLFVNI